MGAKLLFLALAALCAARVFAADAKTDHFLRNYRHGYCPYPLPYETTLEEIKSVADRGFTAMGIGFAGPCVRGEIDFSKLDAAIEMLAKDGRKTVLYVNPRFPESEGLSDVLSTGARINHTNDKCPNYAIIDIFDPAQAAKFNGYLAKVAARYGRNPNAIGFVFGWGYLGETGFYHGDFFTKGESPGGVCAGYSDNALREYNKLRKRKGLKPIGKLPQPSTQRQSDDYIDWTHFKHFYVGEVFNKQAVDAMKSATDKPVGTFAYLPAGIESYARGWDNTPNADFYRSAGSASTFDNTRTLIDSAIGWEDSGLHDGAWDFTSKRMICDEARMIAKGAVFHAMLARNYATEPQWEKDVFDKVCKFLLTQDLAKQITPEKATVALFQPTWANAVIPSIDKDRPFLPAAGPSVYISRMMGLVESFGLPYRLITEGDLADPKLLGTFKLILLPMSDQMPRVLGPRRASELLADPRVLAIPLRDKPVPRSEFRKMLKAKRAPIAFDYDGETSIAGRANNLIFNWTADPVKVRALWKGAWRELELGPDAYEVLR